MKQFFRYVTAGMCGGTWFSLFMGLTLMTYGGNYGSPRWMEKITGLPGYEATLQVGSILGVSLGLILGYLMVFLLRNHAKKVESWQYVLLAFWIPLLLNFIEHSPFQGHPDFLFWTGVLFGVMGVNLIISHFVVTLGYGIQYLVKKYIT